MKWTKSRLNDLNKLHDLFREVSSMNHGSNIVGRILECEKIVKRLGSSNLNTGRTSFLMFLEGLAREDRHPAAQPRSTDADKT